MGWEAVAAPAHSAALSNSPAVRSKCMVVSNVLETVNLVGMRQLQEYWYAEVSKSRCVSVSLDRDLDGSWCDGSSVDVQTPHRVQSLFD